MAEDGSLLNYLTTFKEVVSDFESMEIKYGDKDLGLILLCSLPNSYSMFGDIILYSRDTLTLNKVYEILLRRKR